MILYRFDMWINLLEYIIISKQSERPQVGDIAARGSVRWV